MSSIRNISKILYGLGNPSPEYDKTLHNIGKIYINHLARIHRADFQPAKGKSGDYAIIRNTQGQNVLLFKSHGFMNISGIPYKQILKSCDLVIAPANQIIVHDDLDSKFSKFKIKNGGSPEGHNGLKSIIDTVGGKDFQRLKIGIEITPTLTTPNDQQQHVDSFLGRPDSKDPEVIARYVTSNMASNILEQYKLEIFPQIDAFLKKSQIL